MFTHRQTHVLQVLEARQRIGGRVWSQSLNDTTVVDLGASWFEGTEENPLASLADLHNLPTSSTSWRNFPIYAVGGQSVGDGVREKVRSTKQPRRPFPSSVYKQTSVTARSSCKRFQLPTLSLEDFASCWVVNT
jgi:phytoene dehydrogenase-like protein